jgi:hypothetical protein
MSVTSTVPRSSGAVEVLKTAKLAGMLVSPTFTTVVGPKLVSTPTLSAARADEMGTSNASISMATMAP